MTNDHRFLISMTILDHLGRQLYRNFITVIGEAISNSWDADAHNVWITKDDTRHTLSIVDDGIGMSSDDLNEKFLKVGYSKRGKNRVNTKSKLNRPYIGAKGIGKLALLSCAERVSVASLKSGTSPTGCLIDNAELDNAIKDDITTEEVVLKDASQEAYDLLSNHSLPSGTAVLLDGMRTSNSTNEFLRKAIALSFRFSLIDPSFHIHFNGTEITVDDLEDFFKKTQFAWVFPNTDDELTKYLERPIRERQSIEISKHYELSKTPRIQGFLATVKKPRDLAITGAQERVTVDLYVNGRIRERNIIQHIPTARVPEQYIYGQIHIDSLDRPETDPFTSSREQIIADDPVYKEALGELKTILKDIYDNWDDLRVALKQDGDTTSKRHSRRQRAAAMLVKETISGFSTKKKTREGRLWQSKLKVVTEEAESSVGYYSDVYVTENLLRRLLEDRGYKDDRILPPFIRNCLFGDEYNNKPGRKTKAKIEKRETKVGYTGITAIRANPDSLHYLTLNELMSFSDKHSSSGIRMKEVFGALSETKEKIILLRNVIMHCGSLTRHGREEFDKLFPGLRDAILEFASNAN